MTPVKAVIRNGRFVNKTPDAISYHMHLEDSKRLSKLQAMYRKYAIVYGLRSNIDNRIYIGSSLTPGLRFHHHLITASRSNFNLQAAIAEHGLENFTALVYAKFEWNRNDYEGTKKFLLQQEQLIMDQFPREQLFNTNKAVA